jgi:hypothetical protein
VILIGMPWSRRMIIKINKVNSRILLIQARNNQDSKEVDRLLVKVQQKKELNLKENLNSKNQSMLEINLNFLI